MIISAQEAFEQTTEHVNSKVDTILTRIETDIKVYIGLGEYQCTFKYNEDIPCIVKEKLEESGYDVNYGNTCISQLDGYETDKRTLIISWKNPGIHEYIWNKKFNQK